MLRSFQTSLSCHPILPTPPPGRTPNSPGLEWLCTFALKLAAAHLDASEGAAALDHLRMGREFARQAGNKAHEVSHGRNFFYFCYCFSNSVFLETGGGRRQLAHRTYQTNKQTNIIIIISQKPFFAGKKGQLSSLSLSSVQLLFLLVTFEVHLHLASPSPSLHPLLQEVELIWRYLPQVPPPPPPPLHPIPFCLSAASETCFAGLSGRSPWPGAVQPLTARHLAAPRRGLQAGHGTFRRV